MDKFLIRKRKEPESEEIKTNSFSHEEKNGEKEIEKKQRIQLAQQKKQEFLERYNEFKQKSSIDTPKEPFQGKKSIQEVLHVDSRILKDEEEFYSHFQNMADFLLNKVFLMINKQKHRLVGVEFYFTCKGHQDPFTHQDKIQETNANWYFHRHGKHYRSGNYKGLDISIGNNSEEVGGILIRSIEVVGFNPKLICGPCKCVDHILELCSSFSINDLVEKKMEGNIQIQNEKGPLFLSLIQDEEMNKRTISESPRVGLHLTKRGIDVAVQTNFIFKNYRFFTQPKQIWKGKHYMALALLKEGKKKHEILNGIGMTSNALDKVIQLMEEGSKMEIERFLNQKMSDDDVIKCFGLLKDKKEH